MSIVLEALLAVVLTGAAAAVVALAVKLFRSLSNDVGRSEEARMIQEVYRGLSRLEQRIETLETILSERNREGSER